MNFTSDTTTIEYDATTDSPGVQVGITLVNTCELVFGSLGILGNLICILIFKRRSKHNQTNFLIIMQAGVDSIASALLVSLTITSILNPTAPSHWLMGSIYCKFWKSYVLLWSSFAISTFNLSIISIERYIAVVHPLWYTKIFKRSSVMFIAMLTWMMAPGINIAYNVVVNYFKDGVCMENFDRAQKVISIVLFFWEYFFPLCIMIFSFVCIARKLLKMNKVSNMRAANSHLSNETSMGSQVPGRESSAERKSEPWSRSFVAQKEDSQQGHAVGPTPMNQSVTPNVPDNPAEFQIAVISTTVMPGCSSWKVDGNKGNKLDSMSKSLNVNRANNGKTPRSVRPAGASVRRLNTTKVLLLVSLGFFICWSPNQVYFLLLNLGVINFSLVPYRVTIVMSTCNTCINPFIYAFRMKRFRNEFISIFKGRN